MRRTLTPRERPLVESMLEKATAFGFRIDQLCPDFRSSITAEVMNRCFTKFHLGRGFALHRFTGVDLGPPHDHPGDFTTLILNPYTEDVYAALNGGWTCSRITRQAGSTHVVPASTVHQIIALPDRQSWTLVKFGPHVQESRVYRFGEIVEARTWRQRKWMPVTSQITGHGPSPA